MNRLDTKYIFVFIFIVIILILSLIFTKEILIGLKSIFEIPSLNLIAGLFATVVTTLNKFKNKEFNFSIAMSFSEFRIPLENILSFIGNPITVVCSISLAKGIFLQYYEKLQYFPLFNDVEVMFIAMVTLYLIYISVMEIIREMKNLFLKVEKITPSMEKKI